MVIKTKPFRRNTTISQKANAWSRNRAVHDERRMPAEINSGGDDSEHARHMHTFRRQISEKRRQQRNRDLHRRIVQMRMDPADHETNQQAKARFRPPRPKRNATRPRLTKTFRSLRGDGKLQRHQCGRIVHQAFAFENALDAMRNGQPANNARRGNRVRRRNDCAQRKRRRPGQSRNQRMRDTTRSRPS